MAEIEIKSSLLNDEDFKFVKQSLIEVSEIDGEDKFRVKTLEYINDSADEEEDQFFFDMLEFVRFLTPDNDAVAFTTPNKLIYLNCPCKYQGKEIRKWDFTYDHECLHQLWDTFGVAKKIEEKYGSYDHKLLNIASDCVINDYLYFYRKKDRPDNLVTPEYINDKYGVAYDRKNDTQFSLYVKLKEAIEKNKNLADKLKNDELINKAEKEFGDRKIKPKSVNKASSDIDLPPSTPEGPHSDEYKRGWTDAIKDVLDKKVDPLKYKFPETVKTDYEKGYNDAMSNMQEGLENGLTFDDNDNSDNAGPDDLPRIPWDLPEDDSGKNSKDSDIDNMDSDEAADNAQDSADKAKDAADKAQDKANSGKGSQSDADKAKDEADKAQKAADEAKDAAKKGDKDTAQKKAKEAKDAADKASEAAGEGDSSSKSSDIDNMSGSEAAQNAEKSSKEAKDAADKAQNLSDKESSNDDYKKLAKEAKEAAEKAEKAAKESVAAAKKGDDKTAKEKAKEAMTAADEANEKVNRIERNKNGKDSGEDNIVNDETTSSSSKNNSTPKQGNGDASDNSETEADLEKIKAKAEKIIEKYKNKISGDFGKFITKCKVSVELKESGLLTKTYSGVSSWNQKMTQYVNAFVKKKVFQKKREIERTYKRMNRRSGVVEFGKPLIKGKRVKKDGLTINVAFYIDRSGSMGNCINDVWAATYRLCEALKKQFGKDKVVEEVTFKMHAFDFNMHEIKYGNKMSADGGTMDFDRILRYINDHTKDFMINVILTDAGFSVDSNLVKKFMKDIQGMVLFITNQKTDSVEKLSKTEELKNNLFYIEADSQFTIDHK